VLAVPLISTLFHYGAFNANDVTNDHRLWSLQLGLVGLILVKVCWHRGVFLRAAEIRTPGQGRPFQPSSPPNVMTCLSSSRSGMPASALSIGLAACSTPDCCCIS